MLRAFTLLTLLTSSAALAGEEPLTLEALFSPDPSVRVELSGGGRGDFAWRQVAQTAVASRNRQTIDLPLELLDPSSGKTAVRLEAEVLTASLTETLQLPNGESLALAGSSIRLSPAGDALLINFQDDLFLFSIASQHTSRLTNDPSSETAEGFSPDGKSVSYTRDHNLQVIHLDTGQARPLTTEGALDLFLGELDWVYQEELYGRGDFRGHWWSPDSSRIALLKLDESPVPEFTVVDHLPNRGATEVTHYPKAGDPNPRAELGVVAADGGAIAWIDTSGYQTEEHLIVRVGWTPDSQYVVFQVQDREQTWMDINLGDPASGEVTRLFRESSPAFVDVDLSGQPVWLADGSFLFVSGRSGFHHVYHFNGDGSLRRQVTAGDWEVRALYAVDEVSGWIYFLGTEQTSTEEHVYRIRMDGSRMQRLSTVAGTHAASFAAGSDFFIDQWSDLRTPPQVRLHRADGTELRVLDANPVPELDRYRLGTIEFFQVPTRDGFSMEALLLKPAAFDPSRRYPVLQYNYGGPHAPVVRNAWGGKTTLWHHFLSDQGFLVWMCDNRSASGKGIAPTWQAHQRLGEIELRDIEDGLIWLRRQPWVDGERIGIWGGSYGGFMAAYALTHSEVFRVGIAWAPVTDWHLYDSIYTERFMRTPQNNPAGYEATSVLEAANRLSGKLLLAHGTMDDNVHVQNTIKLAHALQLAGKDFDLMLYPTARHGIDDPQQQFHWYRLMTNFLRENL